MGIKFEQTGHSKSWSRMALERANISESELIEIRKHKQRRLYLSMLVWISAAFLLYCSLFYIGAYFDAGKVIGKSQAQRADKVKNTTVPIRGPQKRNILSPVTDALATNRMYLREGQVVQVTYSVPTGAQIHLKVKQCKTMPILEIFKCAFVNEQEKLIPKGGVGIVKFAVSVSGFYYFDDIVVQNSTTQLKPNYDYKAIWQRS